MKWKFAGITALLVVVVLFFAPQASQTEAQEPQVTFTVEPIVTNVPGPIEYIELPDDSGRFLVVQQRGVIWMVQDGSLLAEPFMDLTDRVLFPDGYTERGLLGLALDPNFLENGYFYLNYSARNPEGMTVIARFTMPDLEANVGDPSSEAVILTQSQPYANHNGGMLEFGPDGYLYISLGDGGSAGDPQNFAQNTRSLLGKILRIDVTSGTPYTIPEDNPFVGNSEFLPEIWAYGLRNAWRFSFDMETGDLYLADVGQNEYEEINFQPADSAGGENYGWNAFEGRTVYRNPTIPNTVMPVAVYSHSEGCSVTGGYVYRGESIPEIDGYYLYGDYCNGRVWWLNRDENGEWQNGVLFETDMQISSFGQDRDGEVYLLDHRGGVYKIVANN